MSVYPAPDQAFIDQPAHRFRYLFHRDRTCPLQIVDVRIIGLQAAQKTFQMLSDRPVDIIAQPGFHATDKQLCADDRRRSLQDLVSLIRDWYADRTDV